jgi:sn-glycerol 3-phosphate transport system substrate-binding protein
MKRIFSVMVALVVFLPLLVFAGGSGETAAASGGKINLVFWHAMGGNHNETINMLADQFNKSQDKITIEPQYQGSYEEEINKLRTAMRTKSGPDIVQIYEGGTRFMADSGFIVPMQQIIDEYRIDIDKLEKNILAYYTVNGKLNSMPFNTSVPLLYYNKTLLTKLGYPNGPSDWKELKEIALKVVALNDPNIPYGFVLWSDPWWFEEPLVQARVPMVDNNNGRSSPATKCVLDQSDYPLRVVKAWKDLKDSGAQADLGFVSTDITAAFTSGMAAMTMASTGSLRSWIDTVGSKFELGTCFFPPLDKNEPNGGLALGGASLYVLDNGKSKATEQALVEFIKFMIKPETQAFWHVRSGYYPITTEAYNIQSVKDNLAKYPQFQTAIDQLHRSENMGFGAIYGSFVEGRATYKRYIEQALMGEITPEECIKKSVESINTLITNYNRANR